MPETPQPKHYPTIPGFDMDWEKTGAEKEYEAKSGSGPVKPPSNPMEQAPIEDDNQPDNEDDDTDFAEEKPENAEWLRDEARPETQSSPAATEAGKRDAERQRRSADQSALVDFIDKAFSGQIEDLSELATKNLVETGRMKPEVAQELTVLLAEISKDAGWKAALEKIEAAQPGKKQEVVLAICQPVLNGHLEAADILSLLSGGIEVRKDTDQAANAAAGYEGFLYYDGQNHRIVITEKALQDPKVDKNIFQHMINHEIAHGSTAEILQSQGETAASLREQMNNPEAKFSSELVKMAREIVDAFEQNPAFADSQPYHIRNVLKGLARVEVDWGQLKPEQQQALGGNKENYVQGRKVQAALEILADYGGIFQRCDGSFEDFFAKAVGIADQDAFSRHIAGDASNASETSADVKQRMVAINEALGSGDAAKIAEIKQKYPELEAVGKIYASVYKHMKDGMAGIKGKVGGEEGELDLEEFGSYGSPDTTGSFGDGSGGKGKGKGGAKEAAKELGAAVVGMADAFWKDWGLA